MYRTVILFVFVFILSTCMPGLQRSHFIMPERIAVLPTINQTADVLGGIIFRYLFYLEMEEDYATHLISIEQVDTLLNDEGITDGGQLEAIENTALYQILNADGLLFIELLACDYQTLGISETRRVKARFSLLSPASQEIWKFEYEVDEGKSVFSTFFELLGDPKNALKHAAEDLGKQLAEKGGRMWVLKHALKPEMDIVIEKAIESLP